MLILDIKMSKLQGPSSNEVGMRKPLENNQD